MGTAGTNAFNLGPRLTITFVSLIVLILGGNALVVSQFDLIRDETDRLTGANQQLTAVLRLQANLLSFHRRLDDLARSMDVRRLVTETESLRATLREQTQQTRTSIADLPSETVVDPSFLPTLDTIDFTLPAQIEAIVELAKSGDWGAIQPRVDNELNPIETQTAILVNSINQQASGEIAQGVAQMKKIQRRILIIVPATALSTFFIASFFGWSIAQRFIELRLEERIGERLRIARELHDTLLQSFNALLLRLQTVSNVLPAQPDEAKRRIDGAIEQAANAITEGRDALHELRSSGATAIDLDQAISNFAKELLVGSDSVPEVHVQVEGAPTPLNPIVRDEVYRIATEAVRNAIRHGNARRIEVEIRYDERHLRLRTRDNGTGIDPAILNRDHVAGHWGLRGMRERARLVGGTLEVWSKVDIGTEIELSIPAASAYVNRPSSYWSIFFRSWRNSL